MRKRLVTAVAMSAVLAVSLAACGGGEEGDDGDGQATHEFDAANGNIYNASSEPGGTLRYAISEN